MAVPLSRSNGRWTGIPGTWAAKHDEKWWLPDSPFALHLRKLGLAPLKSRPFVWSTDINGGLFSFFQASKHSDWDAAGAALSFYLAGTRLEDRNIIAHSHGLQAVLYACANYGVRLNTLISVSSPIRKDMVEVSEKARPNIGYWTHVHSDSSDRTQWFGTLFDGALGIVRAHPLADLNVKIPKVGHSDILKKSKNFHHWDSLTYPIYKNYGLILTAGRSFKNV